MGGRSHRPDLWRPTGEGVSLTGLQMRYIPFACSSLLKIGRNALRSGFCRPIWIELSSFHDKLSAVIAREESRGLNRNVTGEVASHCRLWQNSENREGHGVGYWPPQLHGKASDTGKIATLM